MSSLTQEISEIHANPQSPRGRYFLSPQRLDSKWPNVRASPSLSMCRVVFQVEKQEEQEEKPGRRKDDDWPGGDGQQDDGGGGTGRRKRTGRSQEEQKEERQVQVSVDKSAVSGDRRVYVLVQKTRRLAARRRPAQCALRKKFSRKYNILLLSHNESNYYFKRNV